MPWLLDGNNLAGGRERAAVRGAALALARRERVRIVVFFDGAPTPGTPDVERLGPVEVRYAAHADAAIVSWVHGRGRGWRVATDDRDLARRVRAEGAEVVGAHAFWRRVAGAGWDEPGERGAGGPAESLRRLAETTERLPDAPRRVGVRRRRRA